MKKSLLGLAAVLGIVAGANSQVTVWNQAPDVTENGVDVLAQYLGATRVFVGDDFMWQGGADPLKRISIYGSALGDFGINQGALFTLSINLDNPTGTGGVSHSRPGASIWSATMVAPSSANITQGPTQAFWDPVTKNQLGTSQLSIELGFDVNVGGLEDGKTYWLLVQATPGNPGAMFGWTTRGDGQWNDAAVYARNATLGSPRAVFLPVEYGEPIIGKDLAFTLEVPEPGVGALALLGLGLLGLFRRSR